ncbi:MAG: hypothetical protein KJO43_06565, partial [Phycisphaerae bacterium]|nr:hypothetical protein [Phycisphaerae bacterium]
HAFRARGRDTAPRLPAGDWWGMSARLLRAMLTTGPPIRLTVDPDIDEVDVHAARVGRPLMLALIAIDVRYEICGPVLLHLDCTQSSARFSSEEPRPPARRPWPAMFVTDLASEDASIAAPASDDADSDDAGSDLLTITMPPEAMRPAASRAADTAPS